MAFRDPLWLLLLPLPIAAAWIAARRPRAGVRFPSGNGLEPLMRRSQVGWLQVPVLLRAGALALVVLALARPQRGLEQTRTRAEGIDIALAVDVSGSMLAEDFQLHGKRGNRLDAVKEVVREFVSHRPNDRIGLVVFAGRAYTPCPLTLDHGWLLDQLERTQVGMIEDGTAIGSGLAAGLNRLRASKAKSRVIVLLTDGVSNAGTVTPGAAAQLASALGVKVYAVGAGTKGLAPFPVTDPLGRTVYESVKIEVDDEGLTRVAKATGGAYFRATDTEALRRTYERIDAMEKTAVEEPTYLMYQEYYPWFVIPAIALLLLEVGLGQTWLRVLP